MKSSIQPMLVIILEYKLIQSLPLKNERNSFFLAKWLMQFVFLCLVRNQFPLKARTDIFKSVALFHLSFFLLCGVFFLTFTAKNINRINRQFNWGIKVCCFRQKFDPSTDFLVKYRILPAQRIVYLKS